VQQRWALIVSDYRREYGMSGDDLASVDVHEFMWLLQGLSKNSRFQRAWADAPKTLHNPDDRAAIRAAAMR
jgi:hypothetical protein